MYVLWCIHLFSVSTKKIFCFEHYFLMFCFNYKLCKTLVISGCHVDLLFLILITHHGNIFRCSD